MRLISIFIFSFVISTSFSQTSVWHFGNTGGIRFNSNGTTSTFAGGSTVYPNLGNPVHSPEGTSVVTDKNANVIFYTNGKSIWNNSNSMITNSLGGGSSSTQSCIIVPVPGSNCSKFLIFTTVGVEETNFSSGLGVTLVTVSGTAPSYSVSTSGSTQSLVPGTYFSEKLAVTSDNNGGWWLVAHDFGFNPSGTGANAKTFYVYRITSALSSSTSTSNAVSILNSNLTTQNIAASTSHNSFPGPGNQHAAAQGQMKFSKDGTKLALAIARQKIVDIFNFNPTSGLISFVNSFQPSGMANNQQLYGVEFSPNGRYLYVAEWLRISNEKIFQFDLTNPSPLSTQTTIATASSTSYYTFSALQLGVNDKIYIVGPGVSNSTLSTIDFPNTGGVGCTYNNASTPISGTSVLGLPTVISGDAYCGCLDTVYYTQNLTVCQGDSVFAGGSYQYTSGTYYDTLQTANGCDSVLTTGLTVKSVTPSNMSSQICEGDSILVGTNYYSSAGNYAVKITAAAANGCDSIVNLSLSTKPSYTFNSTTNLCDGDSVLFGVNYIKTGGIFEQNYQAINGCDSIYSININLIEDEDFYLPNDTTLCLGEELKLYIPNNSNYSFVWENSTTISPRKIENSGTYSYTYTNNTCSFSGYDEIIINYEDCEFYLYVPNAFTPDFDGKNEGFKPIIYGEFTDYELMIFDKWGELIFETNDYQKYWNATYMGKLVKTDVYVWKLRVDPKYESIIEKIGHVTVIR